MVLASTSLEPRPRPAAVSNPSPVINRTEMSCPSTEKMIVLRYLVCFYTFIVFLSIGGVTGVDQGSLQLNEDNWDEILVGEWMVEL